MLQLELTETIHEEEVKVIMQAVGGKPLVDTS